VELTMDERKRLIRERFKDLLVSVGSSKAPQETRSEGACGTRLLDPGGSNHYAEPRSSAKRCRTKPAPVGPNYALLL
jgi:hypothetical protein